MRSEEVGLTRGEHSFDSEQNNNSEPSNISLVKQVEIDDSIECNQNAVCSNDGTQSNKKFSITHKQLNIEEDPSARDIQGPPIEPLQKTTIHNLSGL